MLRKLTCVGVLLAVVFSMASESEAARRNRRGRSRRSSSAARMQRYVRARQQQMQKAYQNYQRLAAQRQQALVKARAEDLARRRQVSQVNQRKKEESRQRRKESLQKKREEHAEEDRAAGIKHGSPEDLLKNYDKNGDGVLSKVEVSKSPLSLRFTKTDTNKDGKVTLEELRAAKGATDSKRSKTSKKQ